MNKLVRLLFAFFCWFLIGCGGEIEAPIALDPATVKDSLFLDFRAGINQSDFETYANKLRDNNKLNRKDGKYIYNFPISQTQSIETLDSSGNTNRRDTTVLISMPSVIFPVIDSINGLVSMMVEIEVKDFIAIHGSALGISSTRDIFSELKTIYVDKYGDAQCGGEIDIEMGGGDWTLNRRSRICRWTKAGVGIKLAYGATYISDPTQQDASIDYQCRGCDNFVHIIYTSNALRGNLKKSPGLAPKSKTFPFATDLLKEDI